MLSPTFLFTQGRLSRISGSQYLKGLLCKAVLLYQEPHLTLAFYSSLILLILSLHPDIASSLTWC